jgi:hypothetical protein
VAQVVRPFACSMYVVRGFVERMGTDKPKER